MDVIYFMVVSRYVKGPCCHNGGVGTYDRTFFYRFWRVGTARPKKGSRVVAPQKARAHKVCHEIAKILVCLLKFYCRRRRVPLVKAGGGGTCWILLATSSPGAPSKLSIMYARLKLSILLNLKYSEFILFKETVKFWIKFTQNLAYKEN